MYIKGEDAKDRSEKFEYFFLRFKEMSLADIHKRSIKLKSLKYRLITILIRKNTM